jgi:hypothetical protein
LWLLHERGYKFADRVGDLTPLQQSFIISSIAREMKTQSESGGDTGDEKEQVRDDMERKMRERRKQLQWQSRQNS